MMIDLNYGENYREEILLKNKIEEVASLDDLSVSYPSNCFKVLVVYCPKAGIDVSVENLLSVELR